MSGMLLRLTDPHGVHVEAHRVGARVVVAVKYPDMPVDEDGIATAELTATQARELAAALLRGAAELEGLQPRAEPAR